MNSQSFLFFYFPNLINFKLIIKIEGYLYITPLRLVGPPGLEPGTKGFGFV